MNSSEQTPLDARLLILAPTAKDALTTQSLLRSDGVHTEICATFDALVEQLRAGAAGILIPEEAVSSAHNAVLCAVLAAQPPWSDLPVLVLTRPGADSAELGEAVRTLGNVTLLERPLRMATLLSAVRTAMRARERQYQIRGHLTERARAEEALRLADQRKDDFLATLGHELRNPLAPLLTALQLLKLADVQDSATLRASVVMERQVNHLVRLVDDLLEVSRITRGVIEVRREALDLAFVLRSAIDMSRPSVEAAWHQLTVEMPPEPITVEGDAMRLTQVFANLVTNAAKYTNSGGHIWVTLKMDGSKAIVSVRDDGIGIASDQLSSVFDMFMQIDRSSRRTQGGLGIGLTLVRSLVGMHGGRVTPEVAASEPAASSSSSCPSSRDAGHWPARRTRRDNFPRGACSSLMTIVTPLRRWARYSAHSASPCRWFIAGGKRWRSLRHSIPTPCCSTSACLKWTATKSRARFARAPLMGTSCSSH